MMPVSKHHPAIGDAFVDYIDAFVPEPDPVAQSLIAETSELPMSIMQITPGQAHFMSMLIAAIGAKRTLEVGVFTGYSTLATAKALPADGEIIACDVSEEWTAVGLRHWEQAGVADKIRLHLRPALETLDELIDQGEAGRFDFAFVDADKPNYWAYCDRCLTLLRPGGLLAVDNALWDGTVIDASDQEASTVAIRETNEKLAADSRAESFLLPLFDGIHLASRR